MKDFNIAKYLKENSLGPHAILGAYVDLHALKENEGSDEVDSKLERIAGIYSGKSIGIEDIEKIVQSLQGKGREVNTRYVQQFLSQHGVTINEADYGNNQPVDEVPYVGTDKKLDGFGDEFDQVAPVEEMEYDDDRDDVDPLPSLSPKYKGDSESDDPDADIVNDFVQGMRPYYKKDPSFIKKVIDALRGKGFGARAYDAGFRLNENDVEEIYDNSEQDKFDRMMGLAHEYFEKVSPIVRKTIDALRADGFDDQDIMDFLATDFTLEEEVSVSSSGIQMEGEEFEWKPVDQQNKHPFKKLFVTITDDKIKVSADDGFSSQSYTKEDIKKAMETGEFLRFRGKNLQLNTKMKAWAKS